MDGANSAERHLRIRKLFEEVAGKDADEQSRLLKAACADDPSLQEIVERLLHRAHKADSRFDNLEREILEPGKRALGENPSNLEIWLDFQPDEKAGEPGRLTGKTVSHFKIMEVIGQGGMGVVYRARDLRINREVALKFLPPSLHADPDIKKRFILEAKTASALQHPNIATIHEIDETEDQQIFIAMAYYPGETLKEKLLRGQLPSDKVWDYGKQLAGALAEAHKNGLIHRDIKPGNILIGDDGRLHLLDFGLAEFTGSAGLAHSRSLSGTIPYMSPEQVRAEAVDERSDIWSTGVVLYEMLIGEQPFQGDDPTRVFQKILEVDPLDTKRLKKTVQNAFRGLIGSCLAKDPNKRFGSAIALLEAMKTQQKGQAMNMRVKRLAWGVAPFVILVFLLFGYRYFSGPEAADLGHASVVDDPFNKDQGKVLRMHPGELGFKQHPLILLMRLPDGARIGTTTGLSSLATFYLKVGWPVVDGNPARVDLRWGLIPELNPQEKSRLALNNFPVMGAILANGFSYFADADQVKTVHPSPLDAGTYFEMWFVVDHARNTYDLHVRGGTQFSTITQVVQGAQFGMNTTKPLAYVVLFTSAGSIRHVPQGIDPGYFDDLYFYPGGVLLDSPDADWILLDDFEDGDIGDWEVYQ